MASTTKNVVREALKFSLRIERMLSENLQGDSYLHAQYFRALSYTAPIQGEEPGWRYLYPMANEHASYCWYRSGLPVFNIDNEMEEDIKTGCRAREYPEWAKKNGRGGDLPTSPFHSYAVSLPVSSELVSLNGTAIGGFVVTRYMDWAVPMEDMRSIEDRLFRMDTEYRRDGDYEAPPEPSGLWESMILWSRTDSSHFMPAVQFLGNISMKDYYNVDSTMIRAARIIDLAIRSYIDMYGKSKKSIRTNKKGKKRKKKPGPPFQVWIIGKPITIKKPDKKEEPRTGKPQESTDGAAYCVRAHPVDGFFRNQMCGPGRTVMKRVWVSPVKSRKSHWKNRGSGKVISHSYETKEG